MRQSGRPELLIVGAVVVIEGKSFKYEGQGVALCVCVVVGRLLSLHLPQ